VSSSGDAREWRRKAFFLSPLLFFEGMGEEKTKRKRKREIG
jgi:hypothetical protein